MSADREALRESVARAIAPKAWAVIRKGQSHLMRQERDVSFRKADAALAVIIPACQEVIRTMPMQIYRDEGIGAAGRSCKPATFDDAADALAVFLPGGKTDAA